MFNIDLNTAYKKTNQSLSDFQTGISTAIHATLVTEMFISHTRTVIVDILLPLCRILTER